MVLVIHGEKAGKRGSVTVRSIVPFIIRLKLLPLFCRVVCRQKGLNVAKGERRQA